jgi:hypothetical protein
VFVEQAEKDLKAKTQKKVLCAFCGLLVYQYVAHLLGDFEDDK